MMAKKRITERRRRNLEFGAMDRANRCAICKRDLADAGQIVEDFLVPGKCCSDDCLAELLARQEITE